MPRLPAHLRPSPLGQERISREILAEHQRDRVLDGVTVAFAGRGYEGTSVDDLLAAGKVGVGNFYSLFEGKEDCFLAAFDRIVERTQERIAAAAGGQGWAEHAYLGLAALVGDLVEQPLAARLALIEAQGAGPVARARYEALIESAVRWLGVGRRHGPAAHDLPPSFERATIAGLAYYLQERLLDSRRLAFEPLFGEVAAVVLEPIVGAAELKRLRYAFTVASPRASDRIAGGPKVASTN